MKITRILAIVSMMGSVWVGAGHAQIREQQPAEFPPASYKGKQYVDSQGCVFIRAGIDGDVSWVPRVTRDRKTVCGFKPSLGTQVARAPAAAPAPAQAPVQITLNNAATPAPAPRAAPKPAPRAAAPVVVRQTAPKPAPRVIAPRAVVKAPAPKPAAAPAPVVRRTATASSACTGASAISRQYLQSRDGLAVRCGPQAAPVVGNTRSAPATAAPVVRQPATTHQRKVVQNHYPAASATTAPRVTSKTRIVPKHVALNRINTTNVQIPHGYKRVWEDDRLNPARAEQNLHGRSSMLLVWTQTLPRRLIDQRTGRDVTASVPLVYPYLDVATQQRELGQVTIVQRNGQRMKRVVRHAGAAPVKRQPVYSSRSAPQQKAVAAPVQQKTKRAQPAASGNKYVQIGTYRNAANAQKAAQQIARMGMPARIGKQRRGGTTYMSVQAGPFDDSRSTQNALNRLRGMGYRDAFTRN